MDGNTLSLWSSIISTFTFFKYCQFSLCPIHYSLMSLTVLLHHMLLFALIKKSFLCMPLSFYPLKSLTIDYFTILFLALIQVSWMRSSDMSVLTVGGLVFSSDPRIGVVSSTRPGQAAGTWSLQIAEAALRDSGEYQCQVNSEPKESLDVTLVVRGDRFQFSAFN